MHIDRRLMRTPAGILLCSCLLTACIGGGGNTIRYYLVDPVEVVPMTEAGEKQLAIEIMDVHVPQYLQRFQIVTRNDDNRLLLSDNNQWGENLRKNLLRTLSRNLARRLSTIDIGTPLNRSASLPDYRLHIHIAEFEKAANGVVKLVARWQLTNAEEEELGMHAVSLESDYAVGDDNYDDIVAAMQTLYGQLSTKIAETILAEENRL